jgi:release factor glutamine methyltransferase
MNIAEALAKAVSRLSAEDASLDAQILLTHILGKPRSWVLAHSDGELSPAQENEFEVSVNRLANGEPLAYILGRWEFFGLPFDVTPDVLIPRPETELLVERALDWLEHRSNARSAIDVGTGSGCIAISLAVKIPNLHIDATDISPRALDIAKHNADNHDVASRMNFYCCDLLPPFEKSYDLIVANLPYIPTETMKTLAVYKNEPVLALDGGSDGLDLVRRLVSLAPRYLTSGGLVLLEIESSQGVAAISFAYDTFSHASIHLHRDLADHDRLIEIQTHAGKDRLY